MAFAPDASADPANADQPQPLPAGPEAPPLPMADTDPAAAPPAVAPQSTGDPVSDACHAFNLAVNYAAINYEDFADFSAGDGNYVDYADPTVGNANLAGRTALRQAAGTALSASGIPGVPPDISAPMRAWSLSAAKLVVVMGVRGGGNTLNSTATDLNTQAHDAQMACAAAGAQT
ncbi:hypothetical protein DVS77_06605 [Mycolicibacterium moriokaense]|nr:hypothetical protein DVS77_06605 [Mycolicibacterium moriokaense]